jgi:hypothetical protein
MRKFTARDGAGSSREEGPDSIEFVSGVGRPAFPGLALCIQGKSADPITVVLLIREPVGRMILIRRNASDL